MSSDEKKSKRSRELYQADIDRHLFALGDRPRGASSLSESSVAAKIAELIDRLPELYREVVKLRRRGLKYDEIADQLEIPVGTVKSRMFRGRKRLGHLIDELEELGPSDASDSGVGSGG